MKPPAQTPETPFRLSDSVHHQLNMYALAASAAGVGALALVQPAEAKIVYTPAHVVLGARSNKQYYLDLNHDGVKDFTFAHGYFFSTTTGFWGSMINMSPYKSNGNSILGHNSNASALRAGVKVGPAGQFSQLGVMAWVGGIRGSENTSFQGAWANDGKGVKDRYLGLRFAIKGKVHFGWARVTVSKFRFSATLTGYAYETVANKPIITGRTKGPDANEEQPNPDAVAPSGTLGRLALGRK